LKINVIKFNSIWHNIGNIVGKSENMKMTLNPPAVASMIVYAITNGQLAELQVLMDKLVNEGKTNVLSLIIKVISRPEILNRLVRTIMNDNSLWQKALQNSYRHENGFHKIVLMDGEYFKLRLHHFGATSKIPMENIHDHRWPFASSILSGELKMDIFQRTDSTSDSEEVHHFIYKSDKSNGEYKTEEVGLAYLEKIEQRTYYPGETYLMRTDELHRITNQDGDESITLILTGKPISKECNLYARREIKEEEKQLMHYSSEGLTQMLDEILEFIYPQKN
jgi:hypothetical protein